MYLFAELDKYATVLPSESKTRCPPLVTCFALYIFILKIAPAQQLEKGKYMETILSSCISAAVTLIVCLISNHSQSEKTRALMEYKLEELTKRVDKHNNVVERTYSLEQKAVVQEEQIKVANHRISDLEEKENGHV